MVGQQALDLLVGVRIPLSQKFSFPTSVFSKAAASDLMSFVQICRFICFTFIHSR